MKKSLLLATALITSQLASMPAMASDALVCTEVSKKEIASLFDRWNASLQTLDPAKVAANYAADAVLLPTVSNTPRTTTDGIKDYFVHFLEKHPKGVINSSTIYIGCNMAYDVGTYTFTLIDKAGKASEVAARYSYVYEFKDGQWLIKHHHSSMMPEKKAAAH